MGAIYKLTFPNRKAYIGITSCDVSKRVAEHVVASRKKGRLSAVAAAIAKYGSYQIDVLAQSDDWGLLCDMERDAIRELGTFGAGGYNMTPGGDGVIAMTESSRAVHKAKSSAAAKAAWAGAEMPKRRAAAFARPEFKRAHSEATSRGTAAAFRDPAVRAALKRSRADASYRARVAESVSSLWKDPAYRQRQVKTRLARTKPRTEESLQRQSQKMRDLIAARKAAGTYWMSKGEY